jgi:hypothetical protein
MSRRRPEQLPHKVERANYTRCISYRVNPPSSHLLDPSTKASCNTVLDAACKRAVRGEKHRLDKAMALFPHGHSCKWAALPPTLAISPTSTWRQPPAIRPSLASLCSSFARQASLSLCSSTIKPLAANPYSHRIVLGSHRCPNGLAWTRLRLKCKAESDDICAMP